MCLRRTSPTGLPAHTTVGRYCTVGQACLLRSTYIHDEVIIGDRCILLVCIALRTWDLWDPFVTALQTGLATLRTPLLSIFCE